MVCTEKAEIMSMQDIVEMMEDENLENVTVGGLMFIETKPKGDEDSKVFAMYPVGWRVVEGEVPEKDKIELQATIIQFKGGEFGMIQVVLHEDEIGKSKRIWDKPPTKGLRKDTPWVEEVVQ